mgnify:CR=1 FL=1
MIRGNRKYRRFTQTLGIKAHHSTIKRYCDELWSDIIKYINHNKCIICGTNKQLHSHHLISAKIKQYKYDLNCGVTLCTYCHAVSPFCSPHLAPWTFEMFIKEKYATKYAWWVNHRIQSKYSNVRLSYKKIFNSLKLYYDTYIYKSDPNAKYVLWNEDQNLKVVKEYLTGISMTKLAEKYKVSRVRIRVCLIKHHIKIRSEQKRVSDQWRKNIIKACGKPVQQLDKNGNVIATYSSMMEALRSLGYKSRTAISNCIKGRSKTCGGYRWKILTKGI